MKDENIAKKIVDGLTDASGDVTIEIGPGTGILTKYLVKKPSAAFLAMDVDEDSIAFLKTHYPDHSTQFILQDFLTYQLEDETYSIIGNFPYNISSQLFFKIWDERDKVQNVVCMIQKEVAERICSKNGTKTYGILSVLLQAFYSIEYLFTVPPQVFHPPPKVQSAVIRLKRNDVVQLPCDERLFKTVVKSGFGKRRKTLRNALKEINLPEHMEGWEVLSLRAEQLSVQDFIKLTAKISSGGSNGF